MKSFLSTNARNDSTFSPAHHTMDVNRRVVLTRKSVIFSAQSNMKPAQSTQSMFMILSMIRIGVCSYVRTRLLLIRLIAHIWSKIFTKYAEFFFITFNAKLVGLQVNVSYNVIKRGVWLDQTVHILRMLESVLLMNIIFIVIIC